jgi:glycine dehydrogenase subunit 1
MRYIPLTDSDRKEMLRAVGVSDAQELFSAIPAAVRLKSAPSLPPARTEVELRQFFEGLSARNLYPSSRTGWSSFLGGGCYEHFIPTVVDALASRGEFLTAYTPYQPEVSQGTLTAIFEFQSMVANLFGMDVANASMYDGASAAAEAVLMALRLRDEGRHVYLSKGIHPETRQVIRTYLGDTDAMIHELEVDADGRSVLPVFAEGTVTLLLQQPNFYGVIEDLETASRAVHAAGGLFTVTTAEALAFGVLKPPGAFGADIVAGEGQSLGNPPSFGGPWVGLFAAKKAHVRQMPGRLAGKTTDLEGRDAYCLTMATREQHIRREKATSNICTNHALCALRACIYMAVLGDRGIRDVSRRNLWAAATLRKRLLEVKGVEPLFAGPTFNEFAVRLPISTDAFLEAMEREKIFAGVPLSRWEMGRERDLLVAVTETKDEAAIAKYVDAARKAL